MTKVTGDEKPPLTDSVEANRSLLRLKAKRK